MTTYSRRTLLSAAALSGLITALPARAWRTGKAEKESKTDVLVIGSGLSGIISAVSALESGASVLLIDKAERGLRGGNSRVCLGSFLMPENDSEEAHRAFVEDVAKKSLGGGRTDLYAVLGDNIRTDIAWLESMGAGFEKWMRSDPWRLGVRIASPGQYRGMPKLLETLHGVFEKKGGKALYRTKAKALLLDDKGAVCGCRVQTRAGLEDIFAKAVILGTGGYSANRSMLEAAHPGGAGLLVRGNPWITGDGIALATEIGAATRGMAGVESLHLPVVYRGPKGNGSPTRAMPYGLGINLQGQRFVDESIGYASFGKGVLQQPSQTAALIWSAAKQESEPRINMSVELFKKAGGGYFEAKNVEDLAAQIGVSATALRKTIVDFNAAVREDGSAPDAVPPKRALAEKIDPDRPMRAFFPLTPSITMVYGGLVIDKSARVLEADGTVIPNLYAAGETVNLYFHDYHGGGILSQCVVFGRIAGREAAKRAKA